MTLPKVSVYIGISQDGFIARPDGEIDWLTDSRYTIEGEDYGYQAFIDTVDTLIMGRITFEKVLTLGEWSYPINRVIVLSTTNLTPPPALQATVTVLALPPAGVLAYVAEQGGKHIYLDGGKTIQQFMYEGLIDELIITRLPVLIGQGIPLFGTLPHDCSLRHLETKTYSNGFVQSRFTVKK